MTVSPSTTSDHPFLIHPQKETPAPFSVKIAPSQLKQIGRQTNLVEQSAGNIRFVFTEAGDLFAQQETVRTEKPNSKWAKAKTINGEQCISIHLPLMEPIERPQSETVMATVHKRVARIFGNTFSNEYLTLTFDPLKARGGLIFETANQTCRLEACVQTATIETETFEFAGSASAEHLKKGMAFAAFAKSSKEDNDFIDSITVKDGAVFGGGQRNMNRYFSPFIEKAIDLSLPREFVANLVAALGKIHGEVPVYKSDQAFFFGSDNLMIRTKKADALRTMRPLPPLTNAPKPHAIANFDEFYTSFRLMGFVAPIGYITPNFAGESPFLELKGLTEKTEGRAPIPVRLTEAPLSETSKFGLNIEAVISVLEALGPENFLDIEVDENIVRIFSSGKEYETISILPKLD